MSRLAFLLALVALVVLIVLAIDLTGTTAILFSFVGMPALGLALLLYAVHRWREGRLGPGATHIPER